MEAEAESEKKITATTCLPVSHGRKDRKTGRRVQTGFMTRKQRSAQKGWLNRTGLRRILRQIGIKIIKRGYEFYDVKGQLLGDTKVKAL